MYTVLIQAITCYSSKMILLLKKRQEQNPVCCINWYM